MQYKTIVLGLLEQRTELYEQLRKTRQLLPTMEAMAKELREYHIAVTESMSQANPGSDQWQIPSQALEIAVKELEDRLSGTTLPEENETFSLDQFMAFLHHPTSHN